MALPKIVTENDFETAWTAASLLIGAREVAADDRLDPEDIEEIAAAPHIIETSRDASTLAHDHLLVPINRDIGERPIISAEIEVIGIRKRFELVARGAIAGID